METWQLVLIIVILSAVFLGIVGFTIFAFGISSMMAEKMCSPKHFKTSEEKIKENNAIKDLDGADKYQRTPITFTMSDGCVIHGDYSLNNPISREFHLSNPDKKERYLYLLSELKKKLNIKE